MRFIRKILLVKRVLNLASRRPLTLYNLKSENNDQRRVMFSNWSPKVQQRTPRDCTVWTLNRHINNIPFQAVDGQWSLTSEPSPQNSSRKTLTLEEFFKRDVWPLRLWMRIYVGVQCFSTQWDSGIKSTLRSGNRNGEWNPWSQSQCVEIFLGQAQWDYFDDRWNFYMESVWFASSKQTDVSENEVPSSNETSQWKIP